MKNKTPSWAHLATTSDPQLLSHLLSYARQNYASHTDWYLHHRDTGIKTLGVVLAANFTIGSLHFDGKLTLWLAICALGILAILSILLTALAARSCRQAYRAALENAALVSKTLWAMGLAQPVPITQGVLSIGCPVEEDKTPYVPRYLKDAQEAKTTEEFVGDQMKKRWTTFHATWWTVWAIGALAFLLSLGLIVAAFARAS